MFAVVYKAFVKPGFEDAFKASWRIVAAYFAKQRGAIGSTIHKSEEGYYVTYSRWPDKATRDASWPSGEEAICSDFPVEIVKAVTMLKDCLDSTRPFPEEWMKIIDEL